MMKTYSARVVLDSISDDGHRLITMEATYPRYIHPEVLHHRQFSRGAGSNRARSILEIIREVLSNPAEPVRWGRNSRRMQDSGELDGVRLWLARQLWLKLRYVACFVALLLYYLGLHKQLVNRILEPWQWITVIITSTEWQNFFNLRCHPDAQPEMQQIAGLMRFAYTSSTPVRRTVHLPYLQDSESWLDPLDRVQLSVARCAGISYDNQGKLRHKWKDFDLYDRLASSTPPHSVPFEPVAIAIDGKYANFTGWMSLRWYREELGGSTEDFAYAIGQAETDDRSAAA